VRRLDAAFIVSDTHLQLLARMDAGD